MNGRDECGERILGAFRVVHGSNMRGARLGPAAQGTTVNMRGTTMLTMATTPRMLNADVGFVTFEVTGNVLRSSG